MTRVLQIRLIIVMKGVSSLLEKCNYTTLHIRSIKAIASEVFKSLNNLNLNFMNKMFQVKDNYL